MSFDASTTARVPVAASTPRLSILEIGTTWCPQGDGGGLERMFYNLVSRLPAAGVDVQALVMETGTAGGDAAIAAFARSDASFLARLLGARRLARACLAARRFDIVAAHFALYAAAACDLLGERPLVVHFHGPWADESRYEGGLRLAVEAKRRIEHRVYRRAARAIVLSHAFARILIEQYGFSPGRIRIVPGGTDCARFHTLASRAEARGRFGLDPFRATILSVRRLVRRMGLEHLVRAIDTVRRTCPDVLLVVAGGGPLLQPLQRLVRERGIESWVRLLGFVPDEALPLLYRAADFSVVPTQALEGFGLIVAESLAAGTPALVTPVGGLPEVVAGLAPELILEAADADALARGITRFLLGKVALPSADACRRYALARFDWPVVIDALRRVYEEVA